jgi:hypothetical protein
MTDSKNGTVPSTDPAPKLPATGGRVFGKSPIARPVTGRHPSTRADDAEQDNLKQAVSPTAPTR